MQTIEEALREFHSTYGLVINDLPIDFSHENDQDGELFELRYELVREEYSEFEGAWEAENLTDLADAICDLVYVLVGTAVSLGIPFDRCFAEVQRSNMSKLDENGLPIVRADGKILKGPNFSPPDLKSIIYERFGTDSST
jgi:predicted HAD superfamily Cof-like phosphohydrolase